MSIEVDTVYRLGNAVSLVTYIDGHDVLWLMFDPKSRRFPSRYHRSTPLWYFEKHAKHMKIHATVREVMQAAKALGCSATIAASR